MATQASNLIQQVMTVAVLFFGINLVFGGDLMAGSLIAVNMVAGRIIGPVKQAVGLFSELEKARQIKDEVSFIWNENPREKGLGRKFGYEGRLSLKMSPLGAMKIVPVWQMFVSLSDQESEWR